MDFLELAKKRYSVRKFSSQKVEKEKIDLILEAGRVAPTAVDYQPQRILILESDVSESLSEFRKCISRGRLFAMGFLEVAYCLCKYLGERGEPH